MTSSNGDIFRVTGPLWGEFTGHLWILLKKGQWRGFGCFLWSSPKQTIEKTIETPVIWDRIGSLWRHCNAILQWNVPVSSLKRCWRHGIETHFALLILFQGINEELDYCLRWAWTCCWTTMKLSVISYVFTLMWCNDKSFFVKTVVGQWTSRKLVHKQMLDQFNVSCLCGFEQEMACIFSQQRAYYNMPGVK